MSEIRKLFQAFGVSVRHHESLGTMGQGKDLHLAIREKVPYKWQVVLAAFGEQM